jgi:hypothetical protein
MSRSMLPYGYIAGKQPLITGTALEALRRDPRRDGGDLASGSSGR